MSGGVADNPTLSSSVFVVGSVIGSPYYWALVGAITLVFTGIDLLALSPRNMGRAQGVAIALFVGSWGIVIGLSLPLRPLGSLWWVFPFAFRIAVSVMLFGGNLLAGAIRTEQAIVHPERRPPEVHMRKVRDDELREGEAYDAQWQLEDRRRNRERELHERELREFRRREKRSPHRRPESGE